MSRSALWRQENNKKEREKHAEELFHQVIAEGKSRPKKNLVPLTDDETFRFHPTLLRHIVHSSYFQTICSEIRDWNALVDEIYRKVEHASPFAAQPNKPSAAFCLLLRLLALRCTEKQLMLLLDHGDSIYIRVIGFLYIRYAVEPKRIWDYIKPYLYRYYEVTEEEEEEFIQVSSTRKPFRTWLRDLFACKEYDGTMLPRLPNDRELQVQLLQADRIYRRAQTNYNNKYFTTIGNPVRALYGDDETPVQWYDAVIDRVEYNSHNKMPEGFVVTFPEYGNTEIVTLGEMDMPLGDRREERHASRHNNNDRPRYSENKHRGWYNDDDDHRRRRGHDARHRGRDDKDDYRRHHRDNKSDQDLLYEEVLRREREKVTAKGKNYASRPRTTKASLSGETKSSWRNSQSDRRWSRHRSESPPPPPPPPIPEQQQQQQDAPSPPRKRTAEELAAIQEKKRKLMARYG